MRSKLFAGLACLAGMLLATTPTRAVEVRVLDSLVSLATNTTRHYTFIEPASGESVIVSVTMKPVSVPIGDPFAVVLPAGSEVGIGFLVPDANYIDGTEGVDFRASLAFASAGVVPGSVKFRISGLDMIGLPVAHLLWSSSVTTSALSVSVVGIAGIPLDAVAAPLHGVPYYAQLRPDAALGAGLYRLSDAGIVAGKGLVMRAEFDTTTNANPHVNSWITTTARRYARIYTNAAARDAGLAATTWTNGSFRQALPAYAGVQDIHASADWVYVRSTGLGGHIMGPWTNPPVAFPNLPLNQKSLWRFPRAPAVPVTRTNTPTSTVGYFVDGVAIFDPWSGYYYAHRAGTYDDYQGPAPGGYWNGNAYETELRTFDPSLGHPEGNGIQHVHSNPLATRFRVGDHVEYRAATNGYYESTGLVTRHSPIIGWMADGFPLYGPYGYSNAMDPTSGLRRMTNGFVLRDGSHGTTDVRPAGGRSSRPLWAQRLFSTFQPDAQAIGPDVTPPWPVGAYPLGHYMEDYDYLGDHAPYKQGVDFDLDQFNGRWCVTPEFPMGTYAYFVSIDASGQPAFPYMIGRALYGEPTGGAETNLLPATVTTWFDSMADLRPHLDTLSLTRPATGPSLVMLTWFGAIEGGKYLVSASGDLQTWNWLPSTMTATNTTASYKQAVTNPAPDHMMYRVALGWLSHFDASTGRPTPGTSLGITAVSPYSMVAGLVITLDIELDPALAPVGPPLMVRLERPPGVSVPAYSATRRVNTVSAEINLMGLAPGSYDVVVDFGLETVARSGGFTVR